MSVPCNTPKITGISPIYHLFIHVKPYSYGEYILGMSYDNPGEGRFLYILDNRSIVKAAAGSRAMRGGLKEVTLG